MGRPGRPISDFTYLVDNKNATYILIFFYSLLLHMSLYQHICLGIWESYLCTMIECEDGLALG